MTVRRLAAIHRYVGLVADNKPTTGVPSGSTFLVLDEGVEYVYDGAAWRAQPSDGWLLARKTVTYTGAAGAGQAGTVAMFTVTGDVEIENYYEKVTTDLVGAATLETGISGNTTLLKAQTAYATAADLGEWNQADGTWAAATALATARRALSASIIQTIGATNITAGVLVAYIRWRPLSAGASLVAA